MRTIGGSASRLDTSTPHRTTLSGSSWAPPRLLAPRPREAPARDDASSRRSGPPPPCWDRDQRARAESQSNLASHAVPHVVFRVLPQPPQRVFCRAKKRGELVVQDPFDVGLLAKHEGISRLEKHKVRVPSESVPCANFLRNHNLAFTRHFHDVHRLVRRGLLLKPCPG